MGQFICFRTVLLEAYRPYSKLSLEHIQRKVLGKFLNLQAAGHTNTPATSGTDRPTRKKEREPAPLTAASMASSSAERASPSRSPIPSPSAAAAAAASSSASSSSSDSLPGNFGWAIDFVCFHKLFPALSLEDAVQRFRLWDSDNDGVVDLLELISALILLSSSTFAQKLRGLFDLFHFSDSPGGLSTNEFASLVQRVSRAWERLLGTERTKERWEAEMDEVAKRAMVHLTFDLPSALSRPAHHLHPSMNPLTGKLQAEVSFRRFEIFCGCTPMLLQTLAKHGTTDGEEARAYWHGVLGQPGTQGFVDARKKFGVSSVAIAQFEELRAEAQRIHASFRTWIPLHRHLLNYRAAHDEDDSSSSAGLPSSSSSLGAPSPSLLVPDALDELQPISPAQVALVDVQSKWTQPTASSLARGIKKKHVSVHGLSTTEKLAATMKALELKAQSTMEVSGIAHGSALATNVHAATVAAKVAEATREDDSRNRPAYLAIRRIKAKVQTRRAPGDPAYQHFVYDRQTLRQAKHLFDSLDVDQSGEITIQELAQNMQTNEYLGAAISAFKSLDVDATGTIDFSELLRSIFPLASLHHVKLMCLEVKAIDLTKKDFELLQKIFEWIDEDFDGRVRFRELLAYLRDPTTDLAHDSDQARKEFARDYVPTKAIYELRPDDRLMNFQEAMYELFARSHAHMIGDVRKWASRLEVSALTDKQHTELEQLFHVYDADGSGSVTLEELEAHFTNLGFTEEDNARMFKMMDRDSGGGVDLVEFKRFYRSVYRA